MNSSSENQLRAALNQAGHAIYITDIDGTIQYVNTAFEEVFGYSADEVIGTTPALLSSGEYDDDFYQDLWETILDGETWHHEMVDRTKAGEEVILDQTISPIKTADDEIEGFVAINKDITDKKHREEELTWTNTVLSSLLANLPIGVLVEDANRDILTVNQTFCDLFDIDAPPEALIGHDCAEAAENTKDQFADPGRFVTRNEELLERREPDLEDEFVMADGRTLSRSYVPYPLPEGSGNLWLYQDITQQKTYEQRLTEQRDELNTLNQVLRHDIRNDLQVVTGYLDLLTEYIDGDHDGREYMDRALDSSANAIELTRTARDLADVMLQDDREFTRVPIAATIVSEVEAVRSAYPRADVSYDKPLPERDVLADDLLGSVFRNILKNAVQHNDKDVPTVAVSAHAADQTVTVRVADNGPGIPDDQKSEIFGKDTKGLDSDGTGIGLYLVEKLVTSYEGTVSVEDNTPTGTVCIVELPTAE
ncbi:PAS domain S-box protein [Halopenitus persicus]|uniref:PAS domain S-box protein n=1 Tax=Halopenitus persicus TaxID=1048396 RepID=UPI0015606574|nr:PAS domain S-box protein [Halopenitus persicus]